MRSTRKITSAMKMVAAAKLHRTQRDIGALVPYADELQKIVAHLAQDAGVENIPLAQRREVRNVTIIGFTSNTTFCGAYNNNVGRKIVARLGEEYAGIEPENIKILSVGRQLSVDLERAHIPHELADERLAERPNYLAYSEIVGGLIEGFVGGTIDRVELVYHKFLSPGVQRLVCETLLPIELPKGDASDDESSIEYILEPSREELLASLLPREVSLKMFTAALSAVASEHVARMMAMQAATDNADELIASLSLEYNKQRQQAITTELLDMMGGQRGD